MNAVGTDDPVFEAGKTAAVRRLCRLCRRRVTANLNNDELFLVLVERIELPTFGFKTDGPLLHSPPSPAEMPRNKVRRLR